MRTTKRWNKRMILAVTFATLMLLTVGAWTASAGGFFATGKTIAENEAVWGKPSVIQVFNDGAEKRFYKYSNAMDIGFRYFVYKDSKAIDDGGLQRYAPEVRTEEQAYRVVSQK